MEFFTPLPDKAANSLGMAIVLSSSTPLILLDQNLVVEAASGSFCRTFELDPDQVVGLALFALGAGEWNIPQLRSLLGATASGNAAIDAYELDLVRKGRETRRLCLNAHRLDHANGGEMHLILAVSDITTARLAERVKDDLVREKQVLLQELQHRVANSLQIIASVLMQSARKVQSEEARTHLNDAHHRVMSIATLQKQLAVSAHGEVALRPYFTDLCASIGASMIGDPSHLSLEANIDGSTVNADVSVSLGLIVTELVINALKHAFPGREQGGAITVDYRSDGPAWSLQVGDNGIGMPTGSSRAKPGLGTGIVDALSTQLGAMVIITDASPGTCVSIVHA
ncbi:histidine kinase dimerization/phosphoacceptor domain -containing protein [soil metagenome]